MSSREKPLSELRQPQITPARRAPHTPHAFNTSHRRTGTRLRSVLSEKRTDVNNSVRPGSARGILRRLAKITAATTQKRTVTPPSVSLDKENLSPDYEHDDDIPKPRTNFTIEESIEESDSEIPVAPTPSALLEDTDDDDVSQPTITFQEGVDVRTANALGSHQDRGVSLHSHPDSAVHAEEDQVGQEDEGSTFLTERGRRAISEEPTRISRYSFGSIRMSEFGSELEIRRESDRQQKLATLEADDDYGAYLAQDDEGRHGQETEDIRHLRQSPSPSLIPAEESVAMLDQPEDTFQLALVPEDDEVVVGADERAHGRDRPHMADSILPDQASEEDANVAIQALGQQDAEPQSASASRRQTLLDAVAATAKPRPRKRLKLNERGNMVPALPASLVKKVVHESQEKAGKRKTTLGKEHIKALEQATEWFFEQVSQDLEAYSAHGCRNKRIDADDVLLLMRRQRVLQNRGDLQAMAKYWLPRELRNALELPDRP